MFDLYLTEPVAPFTIALALLLGLLALELVLALLGVTLLGLGADAEIDLDLDVAEPDLGDFDIDFGDADPELFDFADAGPSSDAALEATETVAPGVASWLGLGKVPTLIWFAAALLGFGVTGIALQSTAVAVFGAALPAVLAALPAVFAGLWFARSFGAVFARMLPKTESTALSARHLGRRIGVVTQGTAKRGKPTEVRISDRHGNTHYLRAEPLKDEDEIPAGTEVLVLRHRFEEGYRLVPLGPES
ncbi:OB-fold-containig protein [Dinoroseobacter sp. S375]|uniref:OB-fold-containig protein n=1 Tax=Dinoroseobacter sp. S375 TaxID=3415136 RepID=UPI003C7D9C49